MSRQEAVLLASRTLGFLLLVWALSEISYLPDRVYSLMREMGRTSAFSTTGQYWQHYYLISLGFLVVRIVGFALTSRWLFRYTPEVQELLLPADAEKSVRG